MAKVAGDGSQEIPTCGEAENANAYNDLAAGYNVRIFSARLGQIGA